AVVRVRAVGEIRSEHRRGRLLRLEEQWIALVASLEEDDEAPGADAADSDDLEREVDESVALDELAPVLCQGRAVLTERLVERGSTTPCLHVRDRGRARD